MFSNSKCDYEKIAQALQKELDIDSWPAFLAINESDLEHIPELDHGMRQELMTVIQFALGTLLNLDFISFSDFDKGKFQREIENLCKRRAHTPEDLSEILSCYNTHKETLNRALLFV